MTETCERLVLDVAGLCAAARETDYVRALVAADIGSGTASVIAHGWTTDPFMAALINGTAAHGEDFD